MPNRFFNRFDFHTRPGNSQFVSEPTYYREYFDAAQSYAPVRTIYGDTDGNGPQPTTTYEGRFTTHKSGAIYTKTVTQAGLTVDLPSPDSGIGADAITPRDQANLQPVSAHVSCAKCCRQNIVS